MSPWIAIALAGLAVLLAAAALAVALARLAVLRRQVQSAQSLAAAAADRADEAVARLEELDPPGEGGGLVTELEDVKRLLAQVAARIEAGDGRRAPVAATPRSEGRGVAQSMPAAVQEAVEENRVDVYLQPLVTLPQRRARFMTATCRLRGRDGAVLPQDQAMAMVAHLGLAQELDNMLLFRCVQMVRRMKHRPRNLALFCGLSAASLGDADFFAQFSEYLETEAELPAYLVFELPLAAVEDADDGQARRLRHLIDLGFHLGVQGVQTPRFSAAELARAGISFLRIEAARLLPPEDWEEDDAEPWAEAGPPAADPDWRASLEALQREGIVAIATGVAAEGQVPPLIELGITLAEGVLFGKAEIAGAEP